jgi:hypothetical protein
MRRTIRPCLESLEARALLSGVSSATPGLVDSLTAVVSRSNSGAQVVMTFTETNVSNQDINVVHGPSDEGFIATQGGKTVWTSLEGKIPDFLELQTLKPHQSITLSATWDGRSDEINSAEGWVEGPPLSGTFTISNALDQHAATANITIPKAWTGPVKPGHLTPPVPPPQVHAMSTVDPLA